MRRLGYLLGIMLFLTFPFKSIGQVSDSASIRIISYNIWNGFEKNSIRKNIFIQWMKEQDPEIVALEELVGLTEKDLADLGAAYGHPYAAILKEEGYPVGVTSKQPIEVISRQLEGFWHGTIHVQTYGLDLLVVHFSPFEWKYRLEEARSITEYIRSNKLGHCLVMGDFNAFSPFDAEEVETHVDLKNEMIEWDKEQKEYKNMRGNDFDYSVLSEFYAQGFDDPFRKFVPATGCTTFPTANLYGWQWGDSRLKQKGQRIDYILLSPALAPHCTGATIYNSQETDPISDHYPVSIELILP